MARKLCGADAHPVDAERHQKHEAKRREQRDEAQKRHPHPAGDGIDAIKELSESSLGREPGGRAGQRKTDEHVIVDAQHVGAQARVDDAYRRRLAAENPVVVVGHSKSS